ncbi:adult-specific rigid cuticular protein 15.5-like [Pollicipes pollicipes]|uniref:adult-specific rigid cuticular protein 15.5-like n=1 Tax=Pollicipes pollicipes TaxID=41117 RepID=UPI0018854006|nr:adult-specific rigid cuticular protein 15.5-like [Pollicipes pollicipes]
MRALSHAQDELGQYQFGYASHNSARKEVKTADGVVRGSYSYVDSFGIPQKVSYVADALGFRAAATNLPAMLATKAMMAPAAVMAPKAMMAPMPMMARRTMMAPIPMMAPMAMRSAMALPMPAAASKQHHVQDEWGQYSYGYASPNSAKKEIKSADGVVRGSYSYVDSFGIPQKVKYVADALGFRVAATNLPVAPAAAPMAARAW